MDKSTKVKTHFKAAKRRYYFAEWRKYRGFTQEDVAGMIGHTPSSISQLENGKQGFTDTTLEALAEALSCDPGDLLMRNPLDADAPWSIWDSLKPEQRQKAIGYMAGLLDKTGTHG